MNKSMFNSSFSGQRDGTKTIFFWHQTSESSGTELNLRMKVLPSGSIVLDGVNESGIVDQFQGLAEAFAWLKNQNKTI